MKKLITVVVLCFLLTPKTQAQIYDLVSHLNGWGSTVYNSAGCPTYDYLCLHGSSCSAASLYTWARIGTPSSGSPGLIGLNAHHGVGEGLLTDFNFIPGEIYYIHIGINSFTGTSEGSIKLFTAKDFRGTPLSDLLCQENILTNTSWWQTSPRLCPSTYDAQEIGEFANVSCPPFTTLSLNYAFHVPSSFTYNI